MPPTLDDTERAAALDELARLAHQLDAVNTGIEGVASAKSAEAAIDAALSLAGEVPEVRVLGSLDRASEKERRALVEAAVRGDLERQSILAIVRRIGGAPRVWRALAHVHPRSYAPPAADAWERYRESLRALRDERLWGIPEPHRVPLGAIYVPHRYTVRAREDRRERMAGRRGGDSRSREVLVDAQHHKLIEQF